MKKIQLLVCALLALSLAACGTANTPASSSDSSETQPETTTAQSAETTASEETTATEAPAETGASYADFADLTFIFSSGAGGWQTTLYIAADGSFAGEHYDSDMSETGDSYPDGTMNLCTFRGRFAPLSRVDDLTYTTTITSISYEKEAGTEEIRDNMRYVYTTAYGLDDAETLYFYLPGTKTADLDEECMPWVAMYLSDGTEGERPETIPFTVLYNKNAGTAFAGTVEG